MTKAMQSIFRHSRARLRLALALSGVAVLPGGVADARADTIQDWWHDVTLHGQIEGGISANPARPANGNNFGAFMGDHANQAQLDQITLTVARAVDHSASTYQIGFGIKALYGADARYYEIAGITDRMMSGRYQFIPSEAHLDLHLPWLTRHGLDMQAGILGSPMGVETLDPATRPFYTLAYTTEYSTPFEHVGAMFQWHATERFDVLFGVDTGNQVSFGRGDNNNAAAGYFGLSGNGFAGGRLSFTYLGRAGPENAVRALGNRANSAQRFWNDLDVTYKISNRLSVTGEFNALHDDGIRADTYSFVSFLSYEVTPSLTFNYRGEIYRDNTGLVVTSFLDNNAYMRSTLGQPADTQSAPPTTYGALTLGLTWHPSLGHGVSLFEIRPEIRFDRSLSNTTPFNDLRNAGMFTFGGDAVLGF
ncbi:outer membrane beta-barrel protein [Gluconacetobacter sp. Hr-1-5]|uniref:outer membrane beta-barrel protein n=1 Tax=Gluconacetobacter sp. Hr-1-5 TaxID=3395370 RepID=UPI003B522B1F